MKKKKISLWIIAGLFASIALLILLSPLRMSEYYDQPAIVVSVDIDATPECVFNYLGDSDNAARWSTFVDHITLTSAPGTDGQIGSTRRCFVDADESSTQWDEEIIEVIPNTKRTLSIFNLVDFSMTMDGLLTDQLYEETGDGKTRLSLTLYNVESDLGLWDSFKFHLASYRIASIFEGNLENIKLLSVEECR